MTSPPADWLQPAATYLLTANLCALTSGFQCHLRDRLAPIAQTGRADHVGRDTIAHAGRQATEDLAGRRGLGRLQHRVGRCRHGASCQL